MSIHPSHYTSGRLWAQNAPDVGTYNLPCAFICCPGNAAELVKLTVQPIKVFSMYHLHAPPPCRNVPLQWLAPQFGMASLCRSAHSL